MWAAIRDRAARSGFSELACLVSDASLAAWSLDWRDDDYEQQVWLLNL
jgi:hypothetical protein